MGKSSTRKYDKPKILLTGAGMEDGGEPASVGATFPLTPTMARVAARSGATVKYAKLDGSFGGYNANDNVVYIDASKDNPNIRATIYHELGHAKDYQGSNAGLLSASKEFRGIPKTEINKVIVNRFNRYVDKADRVKTISQVARRVDASYMRYISSGKEVFADSYSQFVSNASSLSSSTPKLYSYFQGIKTI